MAATGLYRTARTGGASGALDQRDGSAISDNDPALVFDGEEAYFYQADATLNKAESDPDLIRPDTNPGTIDWVMLHPFFRETQRAKFGWKDADEIYIGAAACYLRGAINRRVYWASELTFQLGSGGSNAASSNLGNNEWHYIYIDYSAVVSLGLNLLTAAQFLNSTTGPTWSAANRGWYNGNDLCVFAVRTDGAAGVLNFHHDGGDYVMYDASQTTNINGTDVDDSYVDCQINAPALGHKMEIAVIGNANGFSAGALYYRVNGETGAHEVGYLLNGSADRSQVDLTAFSDSSGLIEVKMQNSGASLMTVNTLGYYLPTGM